MTKKIKDLEEENIILKIEIKNLKEKEPKVCATCTQKYNKLKKFKSIRTHINA